jgi:hypothetical protein
MDLVVEQTLQENSPCAEVTPQIGARVCHCVEAFIDLTTVATPYPPVFYRCYWNHATPGGYEIIAFEWSATAEYIKWYQGNIIGSGTDVFTIITAAGGTPPPTNQLVPLLKVTNHSPSLF